jgi:hypothetical protein
MTSNVRKTSDSKRCVMLAHFILALQMLLYRVIKKSLCTLWLQHNRQVHRDFLITLYMIHDMTYLLTAIGLTPGGSSIVHIYIQTIHRTTQWNGIPNTIKHNTHMILNSTDQHKCQTAANPNFSFKIPWCLLKPSVHWHNHKLWAYTSISRCLYANQKWSCVCMCVCVCTQQPMNWYFV